MKHPELYWPRPDQRLNREQPACYEIRVQGWLGPDWSEWFDGMTITHQKEREGQPITILTGSVADQAALHGLLNKVYNLGLPLLAVYCLDTEKQNDDPSR
jgi:hypothetical protein